MNNSEGTPPPVDSLAADTGEGATDRDKFPSRIERYGKAKARAITVANYIKSLGSRYEREYALLSDCGSYLVFRDYYTIGEIRLSQACFCKKHLLCALCAIRRGAKTLSRYLDRYNTVTAENPHLIPYMVTLTVKDGPDLRERFKHLQKSVRALHKRRHTKAQRSEVKKADGAVWSYEMKRGKNSGEWHPHVHCVWLCETPPDQVQLSKEWHQLTGDSFIVDVRPINTNDLVSGFLEVFKYAVKFSDQPVEDTWECYMTLSGRRLIGSFGAFRGIPEPEELTDDLTEELPYIEYFYRYFKGRGYLPDLKKSFSDDDFSYTEVEHGHQI